MKPIKGFEGQYSITKEGQVFSHKTDKWLKLRGSGSTGKIKRHKRSYKTIALWEGGFGYRYFYIHRLVAEAFLDNSDCKPMVNHKDGNPENNSVDNLEWCNHKENMRHAFVNGLTTRGDKNTQTKLSPDDVLEIRRLSSEGGISQSQLGRKFNVSQSNIYMIVKRKNWSYLGL